MLEVRNLTKVYDDGTVALKDVSFQVEQGEFLVIIGLSGSGKSTLLRCINRLIDPTEGQILWNGIDVTAAEGAELRQIRRKIGMIFQHFNLVKRSSVLMNVLSGRLGYTQSSSLFYRFSPSDRQMALDALERVGIARALMQQPEMILADEPVASLDPVLAHSILGYLETLNQEEGMSILCSLHYLDLVQRYANSVIGLRDGQVVYRGTKKQIQSMTDEEFKEIYGEEAIRVGVGGEI